MSATTASAELSFRQQRAEPAGFWVRHRPARWPGPEAPWLDLARAGLGVSRPGASLAIRRRRLDAIDDLVYLPPVAGERRDERDELARALAARDLTFLAQLEPGEDPLPGAVTVYDPLSLLLAGEARPLADLPEGATVVWGLIAGITDGADLCHRGLGRLADAGVARVVPMAPHLEPREKRQLAGSDEAVFTRLFHGVAASERAFARRAAAAGLATRFDRPTPAVGTPRPGNRLVAARLAQIADLWLKLERPEADAQELFRAARWIEAAEHDLGALEREGNLGVLGWLSDKARRQVEAALTAGTPPLLLELEEEYRSAVEGGGREGGGGAPCP